MFQIAIIAHVYIPVGGDKHEITALRANDLTLRLNVFIAINL